MAETSEERMERLMEIRYVSEVQPYLDDSGQVVFTVSTVECPQLKERRITMRSAASVETAERFCRRLMTLLGIEGERSHHVG